ncbi:MAG TPA: hypothetical protein VN154_03815 [Rhizomicrobium sp.]|nr:hypothetical protein [Rhizomicrobium sp.]
MSDDKKSGKRSSFFGSVKQKLIDDLVSAAERNKNEKGETDAEKLRQDQIAILANADAQAESVAEIVSDLKTDIDALHKFADGGARTLNELLVSADPVQFNTFADLDARFGALPNGFTYRYLVPPTYVREESAVNFANNVVRLPSAFNLVIDGHFELFGDEIPEDSLSDWLKHQPTELNRLWSMRVLSLFGILKKSELPASTLRRGIVPAVGKPRPAARAAVAASNIPEAAEQVQSFADAAILQYDGEVVDHDTDAKGGVLSKRVDFENLMKIGPHACLALASLLDHPDIGVRVSAATYLLPTAQNLAFPILQESAASWPDNNGDRVQRAAYHAQQAIWMYEDGNLKLPGASPT